MKSIRRRVCERVRELRKAAGWTQEQLAEKASLSVDVIRKIETARTTPMLETLEKLRHAFGMSLAQLLKFEDTDLPAEREQELEKIWALLMARGEKDIRLVRKMVELFVREQEGRSS